MKTFYQNFETKLLNRFSYLFVVSFFFLSQLSAQTITNVSPNNGKVGDKLDVFITTQGTNFNQATSTGPTLFTNGSTSIPALLKSVNSVGNILEVALDLTNTTYPAGKYDLTINSPIYGILSLTDAFEVDSMALRNMSPGTAIIGQISNFFVIGENMNFGSITLAPQFEKGGQTIATTIVGARGPDTLEIQANFSGTGITVGDYNLSVFASGDTFNLTNALKIEQQGISNVSPNEAQIGETLNFFITGQNINFNISTGTGSSITSASIKKGSNSIPCSFVANNTSGSMAELAIDLTQRKTAETGLYDLVVVTNSGTSSNVLTSLNGFTINKRVVRDVLPKKAVIGQLTDFYVVTEGIDLNSLSTGPIFSRGVNTISSTIIGTRGSDTLLFRANLTAATAGDYTVSVIVQSDTVSLIGEVNIGNVGITKVNPDIGNIGDVLNVFITGQNLNFSTGTSTVNTSFRNGSTLINAPTVSVKNDTVEVLLDLNNTSYASGEYDLKFISPSLGTFDIVNGFRVGDNFIKDAIPDNATIGQTFNVLVIGESVDFTSLTGTPEYKGGGNTISTTIVGIRGSDTLELTVNLSSGTFIAGNYDLSIYFASGDTLNLKNALRLSNTNITGTVFYDLNSNGTQDSGELGVQNTQVILLPNSLSASTNNLGEYTFSDLALGNYDVVVIAPDSSFITNPPDTQAVNISIPDRYVVSKGINTTSASLLTNTTIQLVSGRARCFDMVTYTAYVRNQGFVSSSGVFRMIKNPSLTFMSTSIAQADSLRGDTIYFSYSGLFPGQSISQQISCSVPGISVLPVGSTLNGLAEVYQTDNSGNFVSGSLQSDADATIIRCSYDPNDKMVVPIGSGPTNQVLHDTRLEYTIRFQNTGNDTAFKVVVIDTLSQFLDPSTFEFVYSSHSATTQLNSNRELKFTFDDIKLVDSTTNEPASNGQVRFKISPLPGLADSTLVENRAGIYFDFNPPIITNKVNTTYVSIITSLKEQRANLKGSIFPNPSNGDINILLNKSVVKAQLTVYNTEGKLIYSNNTISGESFRVNLKEFPSGIYFINIVDNDRNFGDRFIIR